MRRIALVLLCHALMWPVAAEEMATEGESEVEVATPQALMLRQTSPVDGYQALAVAGQQIDAAYLEETLGERHGAVVLFHDQGEGFESNGVITPLRHHLPEHGWSTLSLSFDLAVAPRILLSTDLEAAEQGEADAATVDEEAEPEVDNDDEAEPEPETQVLPPVPNLERIEAALTMLQAKGIERVVFLGHGRGAELAIEMLSSNTMPIAGLVLVGMSDVEAIDTFQGLEIPTFEVYGEYDSAAVKSAIKSRKAMMKRVGKLDYRIRQVKGANRAFYGLEPMLGMSVRSWLKATFVEDGE